MKDLGLGGQLQVFVKRVDLVPRRREDLALVDGHLDVRDVRRKGMDSVVSVLTRRGGPVMHTRRSRRDVMAAPFHDRPHLAADALDVGLGRQRRCPRNRGNVNFHLEGLKIRGAPSERVFTDHAAPPGLREEDRQQAILDRATVEGIDCEKLGRGETTLHLAVDIQPNLFDFLFHVGLGRAAGIARRIIELQGVVSNAAHRQVDRRGLAGANGVERIGFDEVARHRPTFQ